MFPLKIIQKQQFLLNQKLNTVTKYTQLKLITRLKVITLNLKVTKHSEAINQPQPLKLKNVSSLASGKYMPQK